MTNKLLLIGSLFMIMNSFVVFPAVDARAEVGEISSAIDVAELVRRGVSMPEIAKKILERMNERTEIMQAQTDQQRIIAGLDRIDAKNVGKDSTVAQKHKILGDGALKKGNYAIAAREYGMAIRYAEEHINTYKLRGDVYGKYVEAALQQASAARKNTKERAMSDESIRLVCVAMAGDYRKALDENVKKTDTINGELRMLEFRMKKNIMNTEKSEDVHPYYAASAQKTADMVRVKKLYQSLRDTRQVETDLAQSLAAQKRLCEGSNSSQKISGTLSEK